MPKKRKTFAKKITKKTLTYTFLLNNKTSKKIPFTVFYCSKNKKSIYPFKKLKQKYKISFAVMPEEFNNNTFVNPFPVNNYIINKISNIYKFNKEKDITFINKNGEYLYLLFYLLKYYKQISIYTLNLKLLNDLCIKSFDLYGTEPVLISSYYEALNRPNSVNLDCSDIFVPNGINSFLRQNLKDISPIQLSAAIENEINAELLCCNI